MHGKAQLKEAEIRNMGQDAASIEGEKDIIVAEKYKKR